jgi:CBS domain-containing protein
MTTDVCTVDREAPFKQVAELLAERRVSSLPVLDGVVDVADELDFELDDTPIMVPPTC